MRDRVFLLVTGIAASVAVTVVGMVGFFVGRLVERLYADQVDTHFGR